MSYIRPFLRLGTTMFCAILAIQAAHPGQAELKTDFLIYTDPAVQVPDPIREFNPQLKKLWLTALERPEVDMQRFAAETIARGQQFGVPGLTDAIPRLQQILQNSASHPSARYAAARALIILESRESAELLDQASQTHGADLRQLIEPALASWQYEPIRAVWIGRLTAPHERHRDLILALRGMANTSDVSVVPTLMAIVRDVLRDPDIRLESAAAAGQIQTSGLEPEAEQLVKQPSQSRFINPLCAIRLLSHHESDAAKQMLVRLAEHQEPVIAAAALHRLNEIDSALVIPLVETYLQHADPRVRQECAAAYLKLPTPERIRSLSRLLADVHPDVRGRVRDGLWQLSQAATSKETVCAEAMTVLAGDRWQGQEMASLLLGTLEFQPAAQRLVELLESPRAEVALSSAWALRKVAVPDTIPAMLDKARRQTERRKRVDDPTLDEQVAYLLEAMGVLNAEVAVPLLMEYIPKSGRMGKNSRSAAIWALGHIKAGTRDAELEERFVERINDNDDTNPELDFIKAMCSIALARMNATEQQEMLRDLYDPAQIASELGSALRWAVHKLTGESLPSQPAPLAGQGNWFLEPLSRK